MTEHDLRRTYLDYLTVLNERRFDDLDRFVADELGYNGEPWTRRTYQELLRADARRIPDLRYDAELLVVGGDRVASRLWFDCAPRGSLFGLDVDGRRVGFAEHVFYRFRDGRIADVRSVIDVESIRAQLR